MTLSAKFDIHGRMRGLRKLSSIFIMMTFLMSSISLSVPCDDRLSQSYIDNDTISLAKIAEKSVLVSINSKHDRTAPPNSSEQTTDHCHCINHSCCVFLTFSPNHELPNDSQKKGPLLFVNALISRNLPPPTRPPAA